MRRKDMAEYRNQILTLRLLDRLLAQITTASATLGLATAAVEFVILSLLLPVALYPWNEALIPVSVVLALIFIIQSRCLRRRLREPLATTQKASEYFTQTVAPSRGSTAFSLFLLGIGLLLCIYSIHFSDYGRDTTLYAASISLTVTGSFFFVFRRIRQAFYRRLNLRIVETEVSEDFDRASERKRAIIKWSVYWGTILGVYLAASLVFRNFHMYALIPILAALNFLLRLAINNPFRAFSSIRNRRLSVHILNFCSLCCTAVLCFSIIAEGSNVNNAYIAGKDYSVFSHHSSYTYDDETGVYTLKNHGGDFRILQLTDIHICGSLSTVLTDRASFDACYDLIRRAQPDLIIVTGDISYTIPIQTFSRDNLRPIYQFCSFMNNIGIPWAMVYGNHDTEAAAGCTATELSQMYREYFQNQPDSPMLYADVQPKIYGRYNQYLRIENPDGSLNRILFLMDSNDYVQGINTKKYDSVHTDQIQWYADTIDRISAQEGRIVPSFVFMHIPFRAFADAQNALETGGDAEYLFGENAEGVSCPEHDTGFFEQIVEKGSTQAVFVGHDHLNNLGVKYRGVDLVYSKSIDYIAYPGISRQTAQRGGTIITLSPNGGYSITQIDSAN